MSKRFAITSMCLITFACLQASPALAAIMVPGTATGGFGEPQDGDIGDPGDSGFTGFIEGPSLSAGQTIDISATGMIVYKSDGSTTGPNGLTTSPDRTKGYYNPLEEEQVRNGTDPEDLTPEMPENSAALIGALVPSATADDSSFTPFDDEDVASPDPGIDSADLFLIGDSLTGYTAGQDGTLYFGVNEAYASNNSTASDSEQFEVTVTPVPEPASLALLACGGLLMLGRRRRMV